MDVETVTRTAEDDGVPTPSSPVLSLHPVFCRAALPLEPEPGPWERSAQTARIALHPGSGGQPLPSGAALRLLMLHICDTARRGGDPLVPLGDSAAALAARLGVPAQAAALAEQAERLAGCRVTLAGEDGVEMRMLDARGHRRGADGWPTALRLTKAFQASMVAGALDLDAALVARIGTDANALDAAGWLATQRGGLAQPGSAKLIPWQDLGEGFGLLDEDEPEFRTRFTAAVQAALGGSPHLAARAESDGLRLLHRAPEPTPRPAPAPAVARPAAPAPRPAPQHVAQPAPPPPAPTPPAPAQAEPEPDADLPHDRRVPEVISLPQPMTGLPGVIWLRRGYGPDCALVGVTPGSRFDPDRATVLTVEPMVMQISGGLGQQEFERVAAWVMLNRDLIDDFWAGGIATLDEVRARVRKAPVAAAWR
jgi:hypothetical protein